MHYITLQTYILEEHKTESEEGAIVRSSRGLLRVIVGRPLAILNQFVAILGQFGALLGHFGPSWAILGHLEATRRAFGDLSQVRLVLSLCIDSPFGDHRRPLGFSLSS